MILFFIALLLSLAAIRVTIVFSKQNGFIDIPKTDSIHVHPTPTLGGTLLVVVFILMLNIGYLFLKLPQLDLIPFILLQVTVVGVSLIGLFDDLKPMMAPPKLLLLTVFAFVFALFVGDIRKITVLFVGQIETNYIFSIALTVLWIVIVTSSINIIDGLDGLLSSYASIFFLTFWCINILHDAGGSLSISTIAAGMALAALYFNRPPARIYLGNVGSHLFGFLIAITPLLGYNKASAAIYVSPLVILLLYPILDMAFQFIRRTLSGKNPFRGDLYHFHHLIYYLNNREHKYLFWLNWIFIINAAISIGSFYLSPQDRLLMVVAAFFLNIALIGIGVLVYTNKRRTLAKDNKLNNRFHEQENYENNKVQGQAPN